MNISSSSIELDAIKGKIYVFLYVVLCSKIAQEPPKLKFKDRFQWVFLGNTLFVAVPNAA